MRKSFCLALTVLLADALQAPAVAQNPAWQVLRGKSGAPFVRTTGTGNISTLSLSCSQSKTLILLALRRNPVRNPARLALTVGDQTLHAPILRTANPSIWGSVFADSRLPDLIAGGQQASLSIDGAAWGGVSLVGARDAMREALAGCWPRATPAQASRPSPQPQAGIVASGNAIPNDPRRLQSADRSAIMRAAGYTQRGKGWLTCEGLAPGDIEELRDLNGDGRREAIVTSSGTACYGNTGAAFQIVTLDLPGTAGAGAGTWRLLVQATGIPVFNPRPGIAWPDIEIGGPGVRCFPFLRWNGQAYVSAGTSLQGKICTLDPAFAPARPSGVIATDEDAIRATLGRIYGWRDGRKVAAARAEDWTGLFSPRIRALLAQCEAAYANADPKANGGEGAYAVTGDQGCLGVPFLLDLVTFEPAPFIRQARPALRRTAPDAIESTITVPPAARAEWGSLETIRFQRIGGRWLVDEVVTIRAQGRWLYSSGITAKTASLRKIARKPAAKR